MIKNISIRLMSMMMVSVNSMLLTIIFFGLRSFRAISNEQNVLGLLGRDRPPL